MILKKKLQQNAPNSQFHQKNKIKFSKGSPKLKGLSYISVNKKENMNFEKRERIESVLSFYSVKKLTESIDEIADAMLKDGFEYSDVKEYIKENIEEILGK